MYIVEESKKFIAAFKTLEEAENILKYFQENLDINYTKIDCDFLKSYIDYGNFHNENRVYLVEIKENNNWIFKCIVTYKSTACLFTEEKRITPLNLKYDRDSFFKTFEKIKEELEEEYELEDELEEEELEDELDKEIENENYKELKEITIKEIQNIKKMIIFSTLLIFSSNLFFKLV